jgi:hypothetical protein
MSGFAGYEGFGQGLDQGTQIMQRIMAMRQAQDQQQQMLAARRAAGNALMQPGAPPPPTSPMPGQASVPTRMMDEGDLPSQLDPTEMAGWAPPPPPQQAMIPSGGAPPLPQPAAPMPIPMNADGASMAGAPPAAPAAPPTGAGGDPLPSQANDAVQGAQETIRAIAQQIKEANPDITPEALFDATGLHIEQMKGVRNDVKDYMQQQVELAKLQVRLQTTEMRIAGNQRVAETNADAHVEAATIGGDSRVKVSENQAAARVTAADIAARSRQTVAQMATEARVTVAQLGADSREAVAATGADVQRYKADQHYRAAVNAEAVRAGVTLPAGPATRQPKVYLGQDGKPVGPVAAPKAAPGGSYGSLKALQDAFKAGKVDAATAQRIAREKGWAS